MAIMLRRFSAAVFLLLSAFSAAGQSSGQPLAGRAGSAQELHSRVSLLSGGRHGDALLAGIEIALDPGFKTYWRNPGESGLPPRFDWAGSTNVAAVEVRWPAPSRHEDAAGVAYTYGRKVILPVLVRPKEPGKPVALALAIEYGICKDICIPAHAELGLTLSGEGSDRAAIEEALAKVPRPQVLGDGADLSVVAATPLADGRLGLAVAVRAPAGAQPVLFAEGPENWYVSASPPDGQNRFTVTVEDKPKDASGPVALLLTLVAGDKAVETPVSLDGGSR
jgi:DsbC/DsbD-like thiol-disulfide interchange protein